MANTDDMSLILAKAKKSRFFEDVKPEEVNYLTQEAKTLFKRDGAFSDSFSNATKNTVIIFGDSLTAQNGPGPGVLNPVDPQTAQDSRGIGTGQMHTWDKKQHWYVTQALAVILLP